MKTNKLKDIYDLCIGSSIIFLYLIGSNIFMNILQILGININNLNIILKSIFMLFYEALITFIIIYIYKKAIKLDLIKLRKKYKEYINKYIKYWIIMLVLMLISNLIITNFTNSTISNNQESIINTLKEIPIYTIIVTVFLAPLLEELVFRLSVRKIFKYSNKLFIIMSGIIFGSLHVITNFNLITDLLFIIPYSIPGFVFAYCYIKSDNIFVPIGLHFIHNLTMMVLQIIAFILI